ncbi:MAG: hypothetical protein AAGE65_13645 [Planctomycetota bacterium]
MICPACAKPFTPTRSDQVVCCKACRVRRLRFRRKVERATVERCASSFVVPAQPTAAHHCYTRTRAVTIELPAELAEQLDQVHQSGRAQALWLTISGAEVGPT